MTTETATDYIKEVHAFYDWLELNELPQSAVLLWHALMHLNDWRILGDWAKAGIQSIRDLVEHEKKRMDQPSARSH
ncbi:hypothetical protein F9802_02450 [Bacillus aerolatus]|uniref:Uncharacterized protein n=1 Tax=Bacillus aerolatus TaxID=2653354 RepID=A0A6I1FQM0_9BACI|nr:hypothetical protein [Bacillus aerolatus]KAB7709014.1 hypothetical protein F9802_02450 [Bacillus aerolatus]